MKQRELDSGNARALGALISLGHFRSGLRTFGGISEKGASIGGEAWVLSVRLPVARIEHCCVCCNEKIPRGQRYVSVTMVDAEGAGPARFPLHGECYEEGLSFFAGETRPAWRWEPARKPKPAVKRRPWDERGWRPDPDRRDGP